VIFVPRYCFFSSWSVSIIMNLTYPVLVHQGYERILIWIRNTGTDPHWLLLNKMEKVNFLHQSYIGCFTDPEVFFWIKKEQLFFCTIRMYVVFIKYSCRSYCLIPTCLLILQTMQVKDEKLDKKSGLPRTNARRIKGRGRSQALRKAT